MDLGAGGRAIMGALRCSTQAGQRLEGLTGTLSGRASRMQRNATELRWVVASLHGLPRAAFMLWFLSVLWHLLTLKRRRAREDARKRQIIADSPGAADMHLDSPAGTTAKQAPYKKPHWHELLTPEGSRWPCVDLPDMAAVVLTTYCAALANVFTLRLIAGLMHAQSLNKWRLWWWTGLKFFPVFGLQGALSIATSYFNERLVLNWRGTVTRKLHSLYFSNMAYYHVISSRKEVRVEDPDHRISREVEGVCSAYSNFIVQASSAVFMNIALKAAIWDAPRGGAGPQPVVNKGGEWLGTWFTQGLPLVGATHGPLLVLTYFMTNLDHHWVQGLREIASSKYQQAILRIQTHIDRISVLRGEPYEQELLERRLNNVTYWNALGQRAWSGHEYAGTLVASNFGANISMGEVAAQFSTCLLLAGRIGHDRRQNAASLPSSNVAETIGGLAMEPHVQIVSWVSFMSLFGILPQLLVAETNAKRILELCARLREANNSAAVQAKDAGGELVEGGSSVGFEGVAVETPDGQRLVDGLDFSVGLGETLLIVGHNGAGKSSIMRCLCGLWPIPAGTITRPGGRGKQGDEMSMYYLPQKPISVIGSLSDQLTYPSRPPGGLPDAELRRWLRYVGLEHLADRELAEGEEDEEATSSNWDELLSLGEQQALSIARLLYHRPHFAILDECTSAVSKGLERRLFELTHALGIACITIAHRPALQEHHSHMLKLTGTLEEDGRGWQLQELPAARARALQPAHCGGEEEEAHRRIAAVLAAEGEEGSVQGAEGGESPATEADRPKSESRRSAVSAVESESGIRSRWPSSMSRFAAVVKLGLGNPTERHRITTRAIGLAALTCLRCRLVWELLIIISSARRCALVGDVGGVWSELFGTMLVHPLLTSADHHFSMQNTALCRELARSAESSLLRRSLGQGLVLQVLRSAGPGVPAIHDAMQRIAEVQDLFNSKVKSLIRTALPLSLAIYMLPIAVGAGGLESLAIVAAGLACVKVCQRAAPDRGEIQKRQAELEARFHRLHSRVTRFAEAIAFSGGCEDERKLMEPRLEAVIAFRKKAAKDRLLYDWLNTSFISKLPDVTHRFLCRSFSRRNIPAGISDVSPGIACASLLYDSVAAAVIAAQREATGLVDLWDQLDGRMFRILELVAAFDAAEAAAPPATTPTPGGERPEGAASRLQVRGLDLVTPSGTFLARKVDFDLAEGLPMLVTGPNGCGKSLLFCTLLGTAQQKGAGAHIALHGAGEPGRLLMAAPQRIYLPLGTLGDQVCYPQRYLRRLDGFQEDSMLEALRSTGLEHLLTREQSGWLAQRTWEDVLSGGEQQRMALARIFFSSPCFALLDECTSMVASDAEESLYHALCKAGTTPLTLSQRLFMPALYKWELSLGTPTPDGWSMTHVPDSAAA